MAVKTSGIRFEITGDASGAVKAWDTLAKAAKNSGGDVAKAGREIEAALKRAEAAASKSSSVKSGLFAQIKQGLAGKIDNAAGSAGLGGLAENLGGGEAAVGALSSKLALAAGATAALGAAAVSIGKVSADAYLRNVEAVDALNDAIGGSVEQSDRLVGTFRGVGVSAEAGSSAMAKLAKNVTSNQAQLERYGVIVERNADGGVNLAGTLLNVATAYQAQSDPARKAQVASAAFGKSWTEMVDVLETSRTRLDQLGKQNALGVRPEDLQALKEYKAETAALSAEWQRAEVQLGRPIVKKLTQEIQVATAAAGSLGMVFHGDLDGAWDNLRIKSSAAAVDLKGVATSFALAGQAGAIAAGHFVDAADAVESASSKASKAHSAFAALTDTADTNVNAQAKFADALASLSDQQDKSAGMAAKQQDAQERLAEATSDGAQQIADAEQAAAESVVAAQERVTEARKKAVRAAEDAADRVSDAERDLRDALASSADDNPLDRERRIADAQRAKARALKDQARTHVDSADEIANAEEDVTKAQIDGAKSIARAQESAAKSIESAQKSTQTAIADTTVSTAGLHGKMQDLVGSTFDAALQTREMGGSQAEVRQKVDEAKAALDEFGPALGLTADQIKIYKDQLDLIPSSVETQVTIKFDTLISGAEGLANKGLSAVILKWLTGGLELAGPAPVTVPVNIVASAAGLAARAAGATGSALSDAAMADLPQFAGGGTFRTTSGRGGLAVLHDGEKVLTPEQQQQGAGQIVINVHGSVMSDRDLADVVARSVRRGIVGVQR